MYRLSKKILSLVDSLITSDCSTSREARTVAYVLLLLLSHVGKVQCQSLSEYEISIYVQSITNLMPEDFVSDQWTLVSENKYASAEQKFLGFVGPYNLGTLDSMQFFLAFAAYHYYVLKDMDTACAIGQLASGKLPVENELPYFYTSILNEQCSFIENSQLFPAYRPDNRNISIVANHLCAFANLYCSRSTLVERQGRQVNPNGHHPQIVELLKKRAALEDQITFEISHYNDLHSDFDNLFFRSTMDENIPRDYCNLQIKRTNNGIGVTLILIADIPFYLDELERQTIIRKVFQSYLNTIEVFKRRFAVSTQPWESSAEIIANNLDLGIAAENAAMLESKGIFSIDFPLAVESDVYMVKVKLPTVFLPSFDRLTARVQSLERDIQDIDNLLSNH